MANPNPHPLPPSTGRKKGSKNKTTLFKEAWKAGLEKAVDKAGGPEQFIKDWIASKSGKQELNSHMLKVTQPLTDKVEHSGEVTVKIVKFSKS